MKINWWHALALGLMALSAAVVLTFLYNLAIAVL